MHDEITPRENPLSDREERLAQLAELANQAHDQMVACARQAVAHALAAGKALLEAKDLCDKGAWTKWLADHFRGSKRTARGYMRLATHWDQVGGDRQSVAGLNYTEATRLITGLACSDGRANGPTRSAAEKRAAAVARPQTELSRLTQSDQNAGESSLPVPASGRQFALLVHLLRQVVAELRRLAQSSHDGSYARHLLKNLESLPDAVAGYQWLRNG
ncbi:MAG TPA: DUF3102 domain-containing protein [Pirellulales bacterium]|nr:DUF3102 domain-containing protein [Pirellulales bacterium]